MNPTVSDVITYVNDSDLIPDSLATAHDAIGRNPLRVACIKLAGWWRRESLQTSRHPYLALNPEHDWYSNLLTILESTPELAAITNISERRCEFASSLSAESIATINEYARERYRPTLRR